MWCRAGVVVIKYETKNDFLYSKQLSGVFQHRLRSPRTYSDGWSISCGRSDSYHLNGSARPATVLVKSARYVTCDHPALESEWRSSCLAVVCCFIALYHC